MPIPIITLAAARAVDTFIANTFQIDDVPRFGREMVATPGALDMAKYFATLGLSKFVVNGSVSLSAWYMDDFERNHADLILILYHIYHIRYVSLPVAGWQEIPLIERDANVQNALIPNLVGGKLVRPAVHDENAVVLPEHLFVTAVRLHISSYVSNDSFKKSIRVAEGYIPPVFLSDESDGGARRYAVYLRSCIADEDKVRKPKGSKKRVASEELMRNRYFWNDLPIAIPVRLENCTTGINFVSYLVYFLWKLNNHFVMYIFLIYMYLPIYIYIYIYIYILQLMVALIIAIA